MLHPVKAILEDLSLMTSTNDETFQFLGDLPPLTTTSDWTPTSPASSPSQHIPHLHNQTIVDIPDQFLTSSLSLHGSISESPYWRHPLILFLSQIQFLTSIISHICQEIRDIKNRKKPQSNLAIWDYVNTGLNKGQTSQNYTRGQDSSNSAKEGSGDEDGWDGTHSSRSTLHPPEPNNPYIPSHHAPTPPSLNPLPSESILEPPGDLSPSPASRIGTLTPSLLM